MEYFAFSTALIALIVIAIDICYNIRQTCIYYIQSSDNFGEYKSWAYSKCETIVGGFWDYYFICSLAYLVVSLSFSMITPPAHREHVPAEIINGVSFMYVIVIYLSGAIIGTLNHFRLLYKLKNSAGDR